MSNQLAMIQKDGGTAGTGKAILPSHVSFENSPTPRQWRYQRIQICSMPIARASSTPFRLVQKTDSFQTDAKPRSSFTKPSSQMVNGSAAHSTCQ